MIGHDLFLSASPGARIRIGDGCAFNTGCHIVAVESVEIGDHTLIAEFCSIRDQNHAFEDRTRPISEQGFTGGPVRIGSNVWIGRGVFVGAGVTIGDGAVIGANSVVTRDIPANVVAAGAPARVVRRIGETIQ
jgi:acetyltransferase-like isoleucine patch superfamily enzyme